MTALTPPLRAGIKRAASALGLEIMTRRGRQDLEGERHAVIEDYLRLLGHTRGVSLAGRPDRVRLLAALVGTGVGEAAHLLAALAATRAVPGDVCECGVGSGATSALLANELRGSGKTLWLYDTFAGLPPPSEQDRLIDDIDGLGSMAAYAGRMSHAQAEVLARLGAIGIARDAYRIVPGLFEDSVAAAQLPERVSFAYVDFDFYAPIKAALEALTPRLSPGGIVVVDDYGFFSAGAQEAVDGFLAAHPGHFAVEVPPYCRDRFAILRDSRATGEAAAVPAAATAG